MSEESDPESREHEPSEAKIMDALRKGQTPVAPDVVLLGSLLSIYVALKVVALVVTPEQIAALGGTLERCAEIPLRNGADFENLLLAVGGVLVKAWCLATASLLLASLAVSGITHRPRIIWRRLKVDPGRLSPGKGVARIYGRKGIASIGKSTIKLAAASAALAADLRAKWSEMNAATSRDADVIGGFVLDACAQLAASLSIAIAALALLDLVESRISWRKKLRMTRQEMKDEAKQNEGDPLVRMRMRSLALSRSRSRMLKDVSTATMVITNPTHFAVALRYVRDESNAPVVVAKGQELIALKIRGEADQRQIPIVEQPELARAMYRTVDVGQAIPPEFYRAVAEIVNFLATRRMLARERG